MQSIPRLSLALVLIISLGGVAFAKTAAKSDVAAPEYKRSDANFYWKGDVLKVYPNAVIIPADGYTVKGESYFPVFTKKKAPRDVYVQVINDWIEPITPPDMPKSLGVASDAMQIREPQGDVQVALPTAPANFIPATNGMTIPNGTVVKTGANGTAAVLFGGVNSARLIPNSEAAMQQTVTPQLRSTEIDLTVGAVFSKVGQRVGEKQDYKVHTPFGVAAARGTDFVSVAMPARTDVWIAQGTVQLDQPDGKMVGMVKSEGTGALKIVRFPVMTDPHQAMMASSETMTAAMNFIPMVNQKIKALRDKVATGGKMSPTEQDYLGRIKKVPCLIKLALVEAAAVVAPSAPTTATAASTAASVAAPVSGTPIKVILHSNGEVSFQDKRISQDEFKSKLGVMTKATPDQAFVVKAGKKVPFKKVEALRGVFQAEQVKNVTFDAPPSPTTTTPSVMPATKTASPAASAAKESSVDKSTVQEKKSSPKLALPVGAPAESGPNDTVP